MSQKIKAIVKRPDEEIGHSTNISNTLENLQKTVEGDIEVVEVDWRGHDIIIICNVNGKLTGLKDNCWLFGMKFVGTLIFVGVEGDDFADLPINFEEYKEMLEEVME